jgi:hypothetical protein
MAGTTDFGVVKLAGFFLEGFELPNELQFGGDQRVVVNEYVGNYQRQVAVLGAQPRDIEWSGVFLYETALARARYFDSFRVRGEAISFIWGDFNFLVIVSQFLFDPINLYHIPYRIRLTVAKDFSTTNVVRPPSLDTVESGILDTIDSLLSLSLAAQKIIQLVDAIRTGNINAIVSSIGSLSSTVGAISGSLGAQSAATLLTFASRAIAISGLAKQLTALLDQSKSGNALVEVTQIAASALALSGAFTQLAGLSGPLTTTVLSGNLFSVSQQYYGTVDAWSTIADANGLTDAEIVGPVTLKLPIFNGIVPAAQAQPGTVYEVGVANAPLAESRLRAR